MIAADGLGDVGLVRGDLVAALDEVEVACFPVGTEGDLMGELSVHFPDRDGVARADLALITAVVDGVGTSRADGSVGRGVAAVEREEVLPGQGCRVTHALDRLGEDVLERRRILVGELAAKEEGIAPVSPDGPAEGSGLLGACIVQGGVSVNGEGILGAQVDGGGARGFAAPQHDGILHEWVLVEDGDIVEQAAAVDVVAGLRAQGCQQEPLRKPLRTRGELGVHGCLDHRDPENALLVVDGGGVNEDERTFVLEIELQGRGGDFLDRPQVEGFAQVGVAQGGEERILAVEQVHTVDLQSGIDRESLRGFLGVEGSREHDLAKHSLTGMTGGGDFRIVGLDLQFRGAPDEGVGRSLGDAVRDVLADGGIGRELGGRPFLR